ncbi:MAG: site-specific DNA-methyltransferase, partial [Planctomycetaceae bacterium]|nr:site-specific DNA-methyltransferase [Planctomycetaceae bacterium]
WAYYGWREGAAHVYLGPNNAVDVWEVKKLNHTEMVHLTEKPIELALRAMHYSSREGENVLDLFGGSGSTLAAAEQAKRNAFLMELDPLYCDVIVKRWEELTGREATLEGDGRSFAVVARERGTQAQGSDADESIEPEGSAAE